MKGRYLLFAVCLGCLAFADARPDDADTARAATARRVAGATPTSQSAATSSRTKNTVNETSVATRPTAGASRATTNTQKVTTTTAPRTINARTTAITDAVRTPVDSATARTNVVTRGSQATSVQSRPSAATARTATTTVSRSAVPTRGTTTAARTAMPVASARGNTAATARNARATTLAKTGARAATTAELRDAIMGRDYSTCRNVYYECMDEFCANKDAQLKRCACSARLHEFDKVRQQLSAVEDKLLDFNQRLLTVNMDKEDAAALFTATEGELAFNQQDTSASKKILDEISKKLNSNSNSSFNQGLSAISLSLNTDAAFDSVDSLMGASTTTKEGTELYNAALPVCREMAAEVCDSDALAMVESGYQMQIEQDCNTIAKTYETQTDMAREKIREGSALLDISRLDIYQKRNSDDILTCKKKMLAQLYDTSVCGANLDRCLDISGQYIDPSTGQAFLTSNLANLATLITRPTGTQTWTGAPGNDRFVSYLDSKKKYLEPAMENCQDIADYVWDEFIEDALAQIKIAQDSKLEEVRQSCTTLTAQCLTNTAQSIADFDARALSTFGVMADKTANSMCASVQTACSALLETVGGDTDWVGGMTTIATGKTYDTIMQTCREVGRACIIQACKSISGNFGMCESIQNSVNRKSIINRTACWPDVLNCVAEAGADAINNIFEKTYPGTTDFYGELYGQKNIYNGYLDADEVAKECTAEGSCVYDICQSKCQDDAVSSYDCRVCRLAEKIWGNCEAPSRTFVGEDNGKDQSMHNKILLPKDASTSTLLSWFADNTNTLNASDSCRATDCPAGQKSTSGGCIAATDFDDLDRYCPASQGFVRFKSNENSICCNNGNSESDPGAKGVVIPTDGGNCYIGDGFDSTPTLTQTPNFGTARQNEPYVTGTHKHVVGGIDINGTVVSLVCLGSVEYPGDKTNDYPSGQTIQCNGRYVYIDANGRYLDPFGEKTYTTSVNSSEQPCTYEFKNGKVADTNCGQDAYMIDLNGVGIHKVSQSETE